VTALDRTIFLVLNNGLNGPINDLWLGYATWLGNGWVAFPIAIIVLFWIDRRNFKRNLILLASSAVLGGAMNSILKNLVHAPRPLAVFHSAIASGQVHVHVMFESLYANSFPSGHAQTISTVAVMLILRLALAQNIGRKKRMVTAVILVLIVPIVALSRIYVGAHFPSDVIGGMLVGSVSSWICAFVYIAFWQRENFPITAGISLEPIALETNATSI
jgi:membrane-associated phospholipid phosphatase